MFSLDKSLGLSWEHLFPSKCCSHDSPSNFFREKIALAYTRAIFLEKSRWDCRGSKFVPQIFYSHDSPSDFFTLKIDPADTPAIFFHQELLFERFVSDLDTVSIERMVYGWPPARTSWPRLLTY